ncbi:MAG TPA: DUF1559 domain-containing protein [Thermogutta sp.]|nr:DUF1559 domain-containing protein [Thermogutta sp.]HPU08023.1 DUF1559 domain-containing protein [Thermogutta sp.]HQF14714.1 DUF1559 domain-containing protein [Thermogutta sp.]
MPPVRAVRKAVRRSQCSNNLKQTKLGLHIFHDTYRRSPAVCYDPQFQEYGGQRYRWFYLPDVENVLYLTHIRCPLR